MEMKSSPFQSVVPSAWRPVVWFHHLEQVFLSRLLFRHPPTWRKKNVTYICNFPLQIQLMQMDTAECSITIRLISFYITQNISPNNQKKIDYNSQILCIQPIQALADPRGAPGTRVPSLGARILSFSCSFWQKTLKIIALLGVAGPLSGKSWIHHWQVVNT